MAHRTLRHIKLLGSKGETQISRNNFKTVNRSQWWQFHYLKISYLN
ncbi:hypothetical protein D049_1678 [Vibrio parahaemolyticus VPTS-2010]|nr:hypothetical protein D046_2783 [Vibrio parahaemolyticus V-223/04]EXJ45585.1 hypothetical protein D049_1678 [Vibrio parahaemolyticus VPTS-2010]